MRLSLLLLLFLATECVAQEADVFPPDSIRRRLIAIEIEGLVRVDGVLDDPAWLLAPASPAFTEVEPVQLAPAQFATSVKVLYNRQFLYFGVFAYDSLGRKAIRATDFKRDFDFRAHDLVSLAFDAFNDQRNAMSLVTNAYGVQRDLLSFDDIYYDLDWDGLWKIRTNRTDSGWSAEFAIPWQTLRYPKLKDSIQSWGFNMYRNRRLSNEITALSPFPRVFSSLRMNYAGMLTNLKPPPPRTNLRFIPYVLGAYDRYQGYPGSVKAKNTSVKVGGEIKWAINSNAVLDLTANTDFAQADADQQVNNVTRFSVFFPERRQFFLENASLFAVGMAPQDDGSGGSMRVQPFFSRSIGLNNSGSPIPIDVGGRFVYRSAKRNYGAILMRQREVTNSPAANFFVARFSENFGSQNRIGGLVTVKEQAGKTNITSTVDGFFRLGESHSVNAMLMSTTGSRGVQPGFAGFAQYYYSTTRMKIWLSQSVVTRNFDPSMGFISRTDVIGTAPGVNWYYRGSRLPFRKILRAFEPGFLPEFYWQASTGRFIDQNLYLFPLWLNFQNGAYLGYAVAPAWQRLTEPFEPLGVPIAPGVYRFTRQQLWLGSDPSRFLNLSGIYSWGEYFNGHLITGDWKLQFAPVPHVSITAKYNRNSFRAVGINKSTALIHLYGIESRLALNPRVQVIGFYQHNSGNSSHNFNLRLSWEYRPLSYIYVVFNRRGFDEIQGSKLREDHLITKLSYLRQF